VLRGGDVILRVDGEAVRSLREVEDSIQGRSLVTLDVVRDGQQRKVDCRTMELDGAGTQKVVGWAGLLLQATPEAVLAQRTVPSEGVYASYRFFGSPASRYDLAPTSHIVEVDSVPTPDLDAFVACTRHKRDGEVLRVKYIDIDGRPRMTTVKLDLHYWPTYKLERAGDGEWQRTEMPPPSEPAM